MLIYLKNFIIQLIEIIQKKKKENYDKLLKKKRKESIDCKKINSLDNEINDLKEKESDDENNVPEINND